MKKWTFVALLLVGATVLGATVLREPIASAAQTVNAKIVDPLDGHGNVRVHEEGTAAVHVLGSVSTHQTSPPGAFSTSVPVGLVGPVLLGPDPPGTNYAITSVTFTNGGDKPIYENLHGVYGPGPSCFSEPFNRSQGPEVIVQTGTVHLDFPQPYLILAKPGAISCLMGGDFYTTVVGYRF
jgi:hypothetical protein